MNYETDGAISTPPGDILKIAILQRRHYCIEAFVIYKKAEAEGRPPQHHVLLSSIVGLFLELDGSLKTSLKDEDYKNLRRKAYGVTDYESGLAVFDILNHFMYGKNLTKFDTRASIDSTDIEANNAYHGQ